MSMITVAQGQVPVTITATGNQDDLATFTGMLPGIVYTLRCNNATLLTIRGFAGGVDGALLRILSVGAGQVDFAHQNAGSVVANRLINLATSASTSLAAGVGDALFCYDATTARWRLVEHEQGAWITPAYASGDFTANSGTWTVDSGDRTTMAYWLKGRTLTVAWALLTTSVSATPNTLKIGNGQWGGFTAAKSQSGCVMSNADTGTLGAEAAPAYVGTALPISGGSATAIGLARANYSGAAWIVTTNTTNSFGEISFEVT